MTIIARSSTATTEGVSSRASLPPRQGDIAARSLRVIRLADIDKEESIELERPAAISLASLRNGSIAFGDFRLLPSKRLLLKGASAVNIGARAFDVLVILAERAGEVVSAKEIESRAYSGLTVTDNALRFQIAALRKALGDGRDGKRYVITVTGRGYCFAAPVSRTQESQPRALAASNDNPLSAPEEIDIQGPARAIRAIFTDRPDIAGIFSAGAPIARSGGPIKMVFPILGRRATLILDDFSPAGSGHLAESEIDH